MALDTLTPRMSLDTKITERYAEYTAPMHDQHLYYPYEESSPHLNGVTTKHHYAAGGHKGKAAMSALTLLAFLFFLHILQQCLKDHMAAIGTPQVMIMTAGKEGEENIAKLPHNNKFDKSGIQRSEKDTQSELEVKERKQTNSDQSELQIDDDFSSTKALLKIKTAEYRPENFGQRYKILKNDGNRTFSSSNFYDRFNNYGHF